jgi:hypothetical protein
MYTKLGNLVLREIHNGQKDFGTRINAFCTEFDLRQNAQNVKK